MDRLVESEFCDFDVTCKSQGYRLDRSLASERRSASTTAEHPWFDDHRSALPKWSSNLVDHLADVEAKAIINSHWLWTSILPSIRFPTINGVQIE